MTTICTIETCDRPAYARHLCELHYRRLMRTGDARGDEPPRGEAGPRPGSVEARDRPAQSRGWCHGHYQRWKRHRDLRPDVPLAYEYGGCGVESCERAHYARGWCAAHYKRWRKHGDVAADVPIREGPGDGSITHGYRKVPVSPEHRHSSKANARRSSTAT